MEVMYFTAKSRFHVVINYLRPHEQKEKIRHEWPVPNSATFHKNVKILRKTANSTARLKIPLLWKTAIPCRRFPPSHQNKIP